jgi:hypothetical protein
MKTLLTILAPVMILAGIYFAVNTLSTFARAQRPPGAAAAAAEQYKVIGVADDDPTSLEAKLNKLGADGWKLRVSLNADQFRGLILAK